MAVQARHVAARPLEPAVAVAVVIPRNVVLDDAHAHPVAPLRAPAVLCRVVPCCARGEAACIIGCARAQASWRGDIDRIECGYPWGVASGYPRVRTHRAGETGCGTELRCNRMNSE